MTAVKVKRNTLGRKIARGYGHGRCTQLKRLLSLIILMSGRGYTVRQLAELKRVHQKTIRRDIRVMEESGVPVYMDSGEFMDEEINGNGQTTHLWRVDRHWMKRFM